MVYEEMNIGNVTEIIEIFRAKQMSLGNSRRPLFRGEKKVSYQPTAGIFRNDLATQSEISIFNEFQRHIPSFKDVSIDITNLWNVMCLAQHHGLPTRLLDWTSNPLVATFFACENSTDQDSAVWVVWAFDMETKLPTDPLTIDTIMSLAPFVISPRILAQSSEFTVHPDGKPLEEYTTEDDLILKLIIKKEDRLRLLMQLDLVGINRKTLFPDLDGLCGYLKWRTTPELKNHGLVRN
jgi:hypothetical protein